MDQCKHCTMRGNLDGCMKTKCNQHESWMAGELRYVMASLVRRCEDEFVDPGKIVELLNARAVLMPNARAQRLEGS